MNENDRHAFRSLMIRAKVTLPSQANLTAEEEALRMDVFWEALKIYNLESVVKSFKEALETLKWFPRPTEIIEFIQINARISTYQEEERPQIEMLQPTEEGKKKAKEWLNWLYDSWDEQDRIKEEKRAKEFETNRANLKKQARLIDFKKLAGGDESSNT